MSEQPASEFASTHWSVIVAAGHQSSPDCKEALETLCRSYWFPLYAYVRRRVRGGRADDKYDVAIVNIDGGERALNVLYTGKLDRAFSVSWHPTKKQILFDMFDPMRKGNQLFTVSTDGNGPPNAVPGQPAHCINVDAAWSPDGKRIVFASRSRPKSK